MANKEKKSYIDRAIYGVENDPNFDVKDLLKDLNNERWKNAFVLASIITATRTIFQTILSGFRNQKKFKENADEKMTDEMRNLVKNEKIKIYTYQDKIPNAFAFARNSISYTNSLKKILTKNELIAVLLHECFHLKNHDLFKLKTYNILSSFFSSLLIGRFMRNKATKFLATLYSTFVFTPLLLGRIFNYGAEKKADLMVVEYGYGRELESALKKILSFQNDLICGNSKDKEKCHKFIKNIQSIDHPSTEDRVKYILDKTNELKKIPKFKNVSRLKIISFLKDKLTSIAENTTDEEIKTVSNEFVSAECRDSSQLVSKRLISEFMTNGVV